MYIRALMLPKEELTTVTPEDSLRVALQKMNEKDFLSIPVLKDKRFLGIISRERIYSEYFEVGGDRDDYLDFRKVKDLMRVDIPSLSPNDEIEKASHALDIYGVPFIAVVNDYGVFEGIITHYAIFRQFSEALGINKGQKITVLAYDIPGQIAKLTEIISRFGGDIISFVVLDPKVKTDVKEIVVRVRCSSMVRLVDAVRDAGFRVQ
ncbi:acetoin utilization protein AcuB [Caloramator quimbayensis]|uniref:Acetoin utilization protein AcuB n=1 Tax=Caloramator quimbayensis TaxID=1147123 RepID=A0A1T4WDL7_9CLOT|nr:CBS domain-containing protein [Caloramator quimbayensis]SKA75404.1 acetoin utilization protein AcuB [Caloramator quimbayensis]